jgi:hypothetical protein
VFIPNFFKGLSKKPFNKLYIYTMSTTHRPSFSHAFSTAPAVTPAPTGRLRRAGRFVAKYVGDVIAKCSKKISDRKDQKQPQRQLIADLNSQIKANHTDGIKEIMQLISRNHTEYIGEKYDNKALIDVIGSLLNSEDPEIKKAALTILTWDDSGRSSTEAYINDPSEANAQNLAKKQKTTRLSKFDYDSCNYAGKVLLQHLQTQTPLSTQLKEIQGKVLAGDLKESKLASFVSADLITELSLADVRLDKETAKRAGVIGQNFQPISTEDRTVLKELGIKPENKFNFDFADFLTIALDVTPKGGIEKALTKAFNAHLILEREAIIEKAKDSPDENKLKEIETQQKLLFTILKDPKILDPNGKLQARINTFMLSDEGKQLFADQVAKRTQLITSKSEAALYAEIQTAWNNEYPAERIDLSGSNPSTKIETIAKAKEQELKSISTALDSIASGRNSEGLKTFLEGVFASSSTITPSQEKLQQVLEQRESGIFIKGTSTNLTELLDSKDSASQLLAYLELKDAVVDDKFNDSQQKLIHSAIDSKFEIGSRIITKENVNKYTQYTFTGTFPKSFPFEKLSASLERILGDTTSRALSSSAIKDILRDDASITLDLKDSSTDKRKAAVIRLRKAIDSLTPKRGKTPKPSQVHDWLNGQCDNKWQKDNFEDADYTTEDKTDRLERISTLQRQISGLRGSDQEIKKYVTSLASESLKTLFGDSVAFDHRSERDPTITSDTSPEEIAEITKSKNLERAHALQESTISSSSLSKILGEIFQQLIAYLEGTEGRTA